MTIKTKIYVKKQSQSCDSVNDISNYIVISIAVAEFFTRIKTEFIVVQTFDKFIERIIFCFWNIPIMISICKIPDE